MGRNSGAVFTQSPAARHIGVYKCIDMYIYLSMCCDGIWRRTVDKIRIYCVFDALRIPPCTVVIRKLVIIFLQKMTSSFGSILECKKKIGQDFKCR